MSSARISGLKTATDIGPGDVARVLKRAKLTYVLVGAHAINWHLGRHDDSRGVDMIVDSPEKASEVIVSAFRGLTLVDAPIVVRFKNYDGDEVIRLFKPVGCPLWSQLLNVMTTVNIQEISVRLLSVEGVLAETFLAIASSHRHSLDMHEDGLEFARVVTAHEKLDLDLLEELGECVYRGGGREILKLASIARAGKPFGF